MAMTLNQEDLDAILATIEGSTVLAKSAQLAAISGGIAISVYPTVAVVVHGDVTGAIGNLTAHDASYYTVTDSGADIEFILKALPPFDNATPVNVHIHGYYDENAGATNGLRIRAYNFNTAGWDTLITLANAAADQAIDLSLVADYGAPASGTVEGMDYDEHDVLIKFHQTAQETGSDMFLNHMLVGYSNPPLALTDIEASSVLAKVSDLSALALEASLAPLALEASLAPLALEASLAPLALEATVQALPPAAATAAAVWDELLTGHVTADTAGKLLTDASVAAVALDPLDIADAVWDATLADYDVAGSTGEALAAAAVGAGTIPAVGAIADAVWDEVISGSATARAELDVLYQASIAGAAPGSGGGAISVTMTIEVAGDPVDGVAVWVTTDSAGTNVVAGVLYTDDNGQVTFMLDDAGTYFMWKQRSGINFTNPEEFTVAA